MKNTILAASIIASAMVIHAAVAVSWWLSAVEAPTMPGGAELLLRHYRGAVASLEAERKRLEDLRAGKWGATAEHVRVQEGVVANHEMALEGVRADCRFRFGVPPEGLARLTP